MNINNVEQYVYELLGKLPAFLFYHNAAHTRSVVTAALYLAEQEKISEENIQLLTTAALLHDTGFSVHPDGKQHEEISCRIARNILPGMNYNNLQIEEICLLIMATQMPQTPGNYLQEILCDADLYYLGTEQFFIISRLLYKELLAQQKISSEDQWMQQQIIFLSAHHYFTSTAKLQLEACKQANLQRIIQNQQTAL